VRAISKGAVNRAVRAPLAEPASIDIQAGSGTFELLTSKVRCFAESSSRLCQEENMRQRGRKGTSTKTGKPKTKVASRLCMCYSESNGCDSWRTNIEGLAPAIIKTWFRDLKLEERPLLNGSHAYPIRKVTLTSQTRK
jgi:hypothetical protein